MPIPTKTSSVSQGREQLGRSQTVSSRTRKPDEKTSGSQTTSMKPGAQTATAENTSSSTIHNRLLPRPTTRSTSAITQHSRTTSTSTTANASTTKVASDRPTSSSRSTSTSSTATRRTADHMTSSSNTSLRSKTTNNNTRIGSNSTANTSLSSRTSTTTASSNINNTTKPTPSSRIARPNPTSRSIPSPTKPTSTRTQRTISSRPTSTTSKPSIPTPTPHPQQPPPPPSSSSSSTTNSNLINELHQLQLTHQNSTQTLLSYQKSITKTLTTKRTAIQTQEKALLALERANREATSTDALASWLSPSERTAAQQIQQLSSVLAELDALRDDAEILAPLRQFETWLADVMVVREQRGRGDRSAVVEASLTVIESLGSSWIQSMQVLREMVAAVQAMADGLGDGEGLDRDSGIVGLLRRQRVFLATLVEEVDVAVVIERAVMGEEREWEAKQLERAIVNLRPAEDDLGVDVGVEGRIGPDTGIWA